MFSYKPINKELGIYFEQVSSIRLYHNNFNIITYFNLTAIQAQFEHIKEITSKVEILCSELSNATKTILNTRDTTLTAQHWKSFIQHTIHCDPIQYQLQTLLAEMQEYNAEHFHESHTRKKRGLLNIVGEISNSLFGTLSQEDAELYLHHFQQLYDGNQVRDEITQKQTVLLQSAINELTDTKTQSDLKDQQLQEQIESIRNATNDLIIHSYNLMHVFALKSQLQDMLQSITFLLLSFRDKQKHFLQAMSLGTRGGNSPIIIPPEVLYKELQKIRTRFSGKSIDLPFVLSKDTISLFYQISSPRARIINNQLMIALQIPLTESEIYQLYKVSSFPYLMPNNLYSFIVPSHEYVAVSRYSQKYISFTSQELTNCHTTYLDNNQTLLTCMLLSPIVDITSDTPVCEISLLTQDLPTSNCDVRIAAIFAEMFIKVRQDNTWIYVLPEKQMLHIDCSDKPIYTQLLQGTGILTINEDCNIKTDKIFIQAFKVYQQELFVEVHPYGRLDIDVQHVIKNFRTMPNIPIKQITTPSVITYGQSDKLKEISSGLKDLIQLEDALKYKYTPMELRRGITTVNVIIVIIILIILTLISRVIIKKQRRRIRRERYLQKIIEAQKQFNDTTEPHEEIFSPIQ